jgi:hypothetical protein
VVPSCLITDLLRNLVGALDRDGPLSEEVAAEHAKATRYLQAFERMGLSKLPCGTRR